MLSASLSSFQSGPPVTVGRFRCGQQLRPCRPPGSAGGSGPCPHGASRLAAVTGSNLPPADPRDAHGAMSGLSHVHPAVWAVDRNVTVRPPGQPPSLCVTPNLVRLVALTTSLLLVTG